jgi:hypothetical protein
VRRYHRLSADRSASWLLALAVLAVIITYLLVSGQAAPAALALFDSPASPVPTVEREPTQVAEASSGAETVAEDSTGFPVWIIVVSVVVILAVVAVVLLTRRR